MSGRKALPDLQHYPDLSLLGKDITQAALPGFDAQPAD